MKNPRNLLLLWTDQQRADTMACYGNDQIETPRLNRLSEESWKLNLHRDDRGELYDLNLDPCELTNLFDNPSQASRIRDLRNRLASWQEDTGDTLSLPN